MKKHFKQAMTLLSAIVLTGSMSFPTIAQDLEANVFQAEASSSGIDITISGINAVLDGEKAAADMQQSIVAEDMAPSDWFTHMNLTGYAAEFYYTLEECTNGDGVQDLLVADYAFSEQEAIAFQYSDGTGELFNGIQILDLTYPSPMTDEEWISIRQNLCYAYSAFLLDHPDIQWLVQNPVITRVAYEWVGEDSSNICQYKIYLQAKNNSTHYDIRSGEYRTSGAVSEAVEEIAKAEEEIAKAEEEQAEKITNTAAPIVPSALPYTAMTSAPVTAVGKSNSGISTLADGDYINDYTRASLYLVDALSTGWSMSDIFSNVAGEGTLRYGDSWGSYVSLNTTNIRNNIFISTDGTNRLNAATDGTFVLIDYTDKTILQPSSGLKPGDLNPYCLCWKSNDNDTTYLIDRTEPRLRVRVAPSEITVNANTLKVTRAANGDQVIEGEPSFTGLKFGENLTTSEYTLQITGSGNTTTNTIQVRITLNGSGDANLKYTIPNNELSVPYNSSLVVDAMTDVEVTTATDNSYVYTGQEYRPSVTVRIKSTNYVLSPSDYTVKYYDNLNAGAATISVASNPGALYTWTGNATTTFTIAKANWPDTQRQSAQLTIYGGAGSFDLHDLRLLAPGGSPDIFNVRVDNKTIADLEQDNTSIFETDVLPSVSNDILSYKIKDSADLIGQKAEITIPVDRATNHNDYTITFTITVAAKEPQNLKFAQDIQKKPVGNKDTLELTGAAEGAAVTYESSNPDIATVDRTGKINALSEGTVTITATSPAINEYEEGSTECKLIIVPRSHKVTTLEQADGQDRYRIEIEDGISKPSEALMEDSSLNLNTAAKIERRLKEELQLINPDIEDKNMAFYDVTLFLRTNGDWTWEKVEAEDFPSNGLPIKIPYPSGVSGANWDFTAVHMFDDYLSGSMLGEVENPPVTEQSDALQFTVTSLSPIGIGWAEPPAEDPGDDPGNGDDNNDPNNNNNNNNNDPNNNNNDPNNTNNGNTNGNTNNGNGNTNTGSTTDPTGRASTSGTTTGAANTGTTSETGTSGQTGIISRAKTGDTSPILIYSLLSAASVALIVIICLIRKELKK